LRDAIAAAGLRTRVASGQAGLCEAAAGSSSDIVIAAIVGSAGLESTLAAARAGKRLLLANKEAVVIAGSLLLDALRGSGGELIPIDSEHNAIFQCLPNPQLDFARAGVRKVVLTASGGPFRGRQRADLASITPDQACAHPNWRMGRKISVDSATLMNKGLEVIEAHWLFGASAQQIEVVVHPQSIVHSLVEYADGSVLAQLGNPDMRTALAHALAWPDRVESGVASLDLLAIGQLSFEAPDRQTFRCLDLAYHALAAGGTAPTTLNAANEIAVAAFLDGTLPFLAIAELIEATLDSLPATPATDLDALVHADSSARREAQRIMQRSFC
jgi:1-deoxy-D-xylulose-5-phosphate reductoisomerase